MGGRKLILSQSKDPHPEDLDGLSTNKLAPMFTFLYVLAFSTLFVYCEEFYTLLPNKGHLSHPNVVSVF